MSSGKVKCTCGWSWDKSDSSKKDMYICHECGRDNSNNMKNGGWLDNYGTKENENESSASLPEGFVGMGNNTQGRNYSPAWGGSFQGGGSVYPVNYVPQAQKGKKIENRIDNFLGNPQEQARSKSRIYFDEEPIDNIRHSFAGRYTQDAIAKKLGNGIVGNIAGLVGSNAMGAAHEIGTLIKDKRDWATKLRESGEDIFNNAFGSVVGALPYMDEKAKDELIYKMAKGNLLPDGYVSTPEGVKKGLSNNLYFKNERGQVKRNYAMGGSIPGAVGFSYARTNDPAPSNGPYAKKTMASAKTGKVIKDDRGQWNHPGKVTEIDQSKEGSYIDMGPDPKTGKKINTPVLAVSDTGDVKLMMPGGKYKLSGTKVTEYPIAEDGIQTTTDKTTIPNGKAFLNKLKEEAKAKKKIDIREPAPTAVNDNIQNASKMAANADAARVKDVRNSNRVAAEKAAAQAEAQKKFNSLSKEEQERAMYDYYNQKQGTISEYTPDSMLSKLDQSALAPFTALKDLYQTGEVRDNLLKSIVNNPETANAYDAAYLGTLGYAAAPAVGSAIAAAPAAISPYATMIGNSLATDAVIGGNTIAGLNLGNAINAGFATHGAMNIGPDAQAWYNDPTREGFDKMAWDTLEMLPAVGPTAKTLGEGFTIAGKALGTEEGLLSNAYKLNPLAERLNNANSSYRVAGINAFEDFKNTGVLRSRNTEPGQLVEGTNFMMPPRPTSFPSFQKGYADMAYAKPEGSVVFETGLPTFKRGEINPVTGFPIKGRHYAHRVIDPVTGKTMAEIPAADIKVFGDKPDWLKGYQQLEVPIKPAAPKTWEMQNLPGLHLQSTMENGAISKIVEPKTGLVNTEQALAIIGKESGGADKVALIKQGLGENIPKKMDYNQFRKAVQDQLIPLETNLTEHASNYGLGKIGYPGPKRSTFEAAINNTNQDIQNLTNKINELKSNPANADMLPEYQTRLDEAYAQLAKNQEGLKNLPLENKTLLFSNKDKFGKGSSAHNNPDDTLGHAHYLVDAETPDILTVTQLQSDAFQSTNRIMPKNFNPEVSKMQMERGERVYNNSLATIEKMKAEGAADYEIKQMQEIADAQKQNNILTKGHVENFSQKSLLDKTHQERYIQEIVNHATQRGDINKVRLPTSETAANVQGYASRKRWNVNLNEGDEVILLDGSTGKVTDDTFDNLIEITKSDGNKVNINYSDAGHGSSKTPPVKSINNVELKEVSGFMPEHQTILKKYSEQPKLIKKLYGVEPKIVTDSKGNTWYEFDIPKNFKEGKGEIKAFKQGGMIKNNNRLRQEQKGLVNLDQLTNFTNYNKPQPGGWLEKYN